ncbi:MAG: hypothetical protein ACRCZS_25465 [Chroococcidiopsis sp.]
MRECDHDRAISLVSLLQSEYAAGKAVEQIVAEFWPIVEALCLMMPTVAPLHWQMDELKGSPGLVRSFFLEPECTFIQIHTFEPKRRDKPPEEERLEDLPFPSGGNLRADQIAAFINSTQWPPSEIQSLFAMVSREELSSISYSLSELADPDRRIAERAKAIAEQEYGDDAIDLAMDQATSEMFG